MRRLNLFGYITNMLKMFALPNRFTTSRDMLENIYDFNLLSNLLEFDVTFVKQHYLPTI